MELKIVQSIQYLSNGIIVKSTARDPGLRDRQDIQMFRYD